MAYIIKIWLFLLYLLSSAGRFATKLGLIIQHHKPECPVQNLDYYIQGQGHSKGSKCQWMLVRMIFSESQNILLPNVVWWCGIMSQSIMCIKFFLLFLLSSRSGSQRGLIWSKYDSFYFIFWIIDSLATKLGLMIHHHKPECLMNIAVWITPHKVKVMVKGQNVSVCPGDIF